MRNNKFKWLAVIFITAWAIYSFYPPQGRNQIDVFNEMASKLEELQEDIKKKERQAMFGRISLGLVHDLSVPMQNIGNTSKLMMKMWDDLEYREIFKRTVERELAQIRRLLDDLRNLAKPVPLEKVCRGPLVDQTQYSIDVKEWNYKAMTIKTI